MLSEFQKDYSQIAFEHGIELGLDVEPQRTNKIHTHNHTIDGTFSFILFLFFLVEPWNQRRNILSFSFIHFKCVQTFLQLVMVRA